MQTKQPIGLRDSPGRNGPAELLFSKQRLFKIRARRAARRITP
jgi:hypothetical protein